MSKENLKNLAENFGITLFEKFANKNFGSMIKTEFEVISFYYILQKIQMEKPKNDDGTEKFISDYELSMALGVTESKIRNLRIKSHIYFADANTDYWKPKFKKLIANQDSISFNPTNYLVEMLIPDVTLISEIRHCLETHQLYDEVVRNSHLFKCPLKTFLKLCQIANSSDKSKISQKPQIKRLDSLPTDIKEIMTLAGVDLVKDETLDIAKKVLKTIGSSALIALSKFIY